MAANSPSYINGTAFNNYSKILLTRGVEFILNGEKSACPKDLVIATEKFSVSRITPQKKIF